MYHKQTTRHAAKGMTLVELLIVISIIIMLVSILMPSFNEVRRSIYATKSKARIAELATGIAAFQKEYNYYPGQDNWGDFAKGDNVSGSSALADALFPEDEEDSTKRIAKYAPLNLSTSTAQGLTNFAPTTAVMSSKALLAMRAVSISP